MDEQKDPRPDEEMQRQWREALESDSMGNEYDCWLSGFNRGKQAAALSQPAAQGDSSHHAGGEFGSIPAPWPTDAERLDFINGDGGTIRSEVWHGLVPRYIHWGKGQNVRAAIDASILASKATP